MARKKNTQPIVPVVMIGAIILATFLATGNHYCKTLPGELEELGKEVTTLGDQFVVYQMTHTVNESDIYIHEFRPDWVERHIIRMQGYNATLLNLTKYPERKNITDTLNRKLDDINSLYDTEEKCNWFGADVKSEVDFHIVVAASYFSGYISSNDSYRRVLVDSRGVVIG